MEELDDLRQKLEAFQKEVSRLLIELEDLKSSEKALIKEHDGELWTPKKFKNAAEHHRKACDFILKAIPNIKSHEIFSEIYYLSGYILECSLKAFILFSDHKNRVTKTQLIEMGLWKHDIGNLWIMACDKGRIRRNDFEWSELAKNWKSELRYEIHNSDYTDRSKIISHYEKTIVRIHDELKKRY